MIHFFLSCKRSFGVLIFGLLINTLVNNIQERSCDDCSIHVIDQTNQMNLMNITCFVPVTSRFLHIQVNNRIGTTSYSVEFLQGSS